jgi:hypothetical protein
LAQVTAPAVLLCAVHAMAGPRSGGALLAALQAKVPLVSVSVLLRQLFPLHSLHTLVAVPEPV